MKYMLSWRLAPGQHKRAAEAFLANGAPMPEGLTSLGRWHAPGSARGWLIAEGDVNAVAEHVATWADMLEIEVTPVLGDEEAGAAHAKAYGG